MSILIILGFVFEASLIAAIIWVWRHEETVKAFEEKAWTAAKERFSDIRDRVTNRRAKAARRNLVENSRQKSLAAYINSSMKKSVPAIARYGEGHVLDVLGDFKSLPKSTPREWLAYQYPFSWKGLHVQPYENGYFVVTKL